MSIEKLKTDENQGKLYDRIAKDFAEMRTIFYKEQKYLDALMHYLKPKAHILDVGCGSGCPIAAYFIEKGFQVTGIDGSKKLLEIAKEKNPSMNLIYGDVRTIKLAQQYDAIVEWWCLFHVPKLFHEDMIIQFSRWIKKSGIVEFTTGDRAYEDTSSDMLHQPLSFYSLEPMVYEKYLKKHGFKILLRESDQPNHLVWIVQYQ